MFRPLASAVARQSWLRKVALTTPAIRGLAWRFVAGEDLDAGVAVVRKLEEQGVAATLNHVGTHVRSRSEAQAAGDAVVAALARVASEGLAAHVSIKLTQLGLDIDPDLCRAEVWRILDAARAAGTFVRIDMEESPYLGVTVALYEDARREFGDTTVGIAWQSYLRGGRRQLERLVEQGSAIRLVKGGYWEPPETVFRRKDEIDAAFLADIDLVLAAGRSPAIATHDPVSIEHALRSAVSAGRDASGFEFQMLYGVGRDLQASLVRDGYRVRCYVPYGAQWYEYVLGCLRRLPGEAVRRARRRPAHTP